MQLAALISAAAPPPPPLAIRVAHRSMQWWWWWTIKVFSFSRPFFLLSHSIFRLKLISAPHRRRFFIFLHFIEVTTFDKNFCGSQRAHNYCEILRNTKIKRNFFFSLEEREREKSLRTWNINCKSSFVHHQMCNEKKEQRERNGKLLFGWVKMFISQKKRFNAILWLNTTKKRRTNSTAFFLNEEFTWKRALCEKQWKEAKTLVSFNCQPPVELTNTQRLTGLNIALHTKVC